jgi:uncharacterized membrane protein YfbV (UPF0208 family)
MALLASRIFKVFSWWLGHTATGKYLLQQLVVWFHLVLKSLSGTRRAIENSRVYN